MFPPRIIRSIVACTLACGLLATTTSAVADECAPNLPDGATTCRPPAMTQDLRSPDARDAAGAEFIARQMEQYCETLGEHRADHAPPARGRLERTGPAPPRGTCRASAGGSPRGRSGAPPANRGGRRPAGEAQAEGARAADLASEALALGGGDPLLDVDADDV